MHRRIETLLGNLHDFPVGARIVERLPVSSSAMTHRLLRLPSSIGDLGLKLDGGLRVRDGDVLVADETRVIALEVLPDDVLVAYPDSIAQAVEIAHALGNRHIPVIREGDAMNSRGRTLLRSHRSTPRAASLARAAIVAT